MKPSGKIGVQEIALCDISNYLKTHGAPRRVRSRGRAAEVWNVNTNTLNTPETRVLNQQLGIHTINKGNKENQAIDLFESTINPPCQFDFLIDLTDIYKYNAHDYYTEHPDKKKTHIEVGIPKVEAEPKPDLDKLFERGDKVNYTPLQFTYARSFNTYLKSFYGDKDLYPVQGTFVWLTIPKHNDICIIEHPNGFPAKCLIESFSLSYAPLKIYLKYVFAAQGELINN
jgi:hypothetical protein